ncbi:hypothetical protein CA233_12460 [Sphingomonas sp. ABOLD]|nr:hypothetical protein CA234_12880 [Sphingomonas sp. ABOLE]RSV46724.1 hypothetical protein CA233_12460 [Sphingomonas sp. ABOLD]
MFGYRCWGGGQLQITSLQSPSRLREGAPSGKVSASRTRACPSAGCSPP